MVKKDSSNDKPFGFGNTSRRFTESGRRAKCKLAKDRFVFDQAMQGNDCEKILRGGDFVVQKRDFFGDKEGEPTVYDIKLGGSPLTEAQRKRQRQLGRSRYRVVRY
jgi:hypothetical protein